MIWFVPLALFQSCSSFGLIHSVIQFHNSVLIFDLVVHSFPHLSCQVQLCVILVILLFLEPTLLAISPWLGRGLFSFVTQAVHPPSISCNFPSVSFDLQFCHSKSVFIAVEQPLVSVLFQHFQPFLFQLQSIQGAVEWLSHNWASPAKTLALTWPILP